MDPFAVLGVEPDASPEAVTAAYRKLAKRWHPDRGGGVEAARRMAQINAAYEQLRSGEAHRSAAPKTRPAQQTARRHPRPGSWLAADVRAALGPELLSALVPGEQVTFIVPVATWASPDSVLAVTDRRLLWLLGDAIGSRVRSLRFVDISDVQDRLSWPRRRTAVLQVRTLAGRRLSFAELEPRTATSITRHIGARMP